MAVGVTPLVANWWPKKSRSRPRTSSSLRSVSRLKPKCQSRWLTAAVLKTGGVGVRPGMIASTTASRPTRSGWSAARSGRWLLVGEISTEGPGAGGGGGNGWVILCQHDADGAAGIGGSMNRC